MKPSEATAAIAQLAQPLEVEKTALKAAEEQLDDDAIAKTTANLGIIRDQARTYCEAIAEDVTITDERIDAIIAMAAEGATPAQVKTAIYAKHLSRNKPLTLPHGKYARLSRGKGWCRKGTGRNATWGEKTDNGYRINEPGKRLVGSTDGFNRKDYNPYTVTEIVVGNSRVLIAN